MENQCEVLKSLCESIGCRWPPRDQSEAVAILTCAGWEQRRIEQFLNTSGYDGFEDVGELPRGYTSVGEPRFRDQPATIEEHTAEFGFPILTPMLVEGLRRYVAQQSIVSEEKRARQVNSEVESDIKAKQPPSEDPRKDRESERLTVVGASKERLSVSSSPFNEELAQEIADSSRVFLDRLESLCGEFAEQFQLAMKSDGSSREKRWSPPGQFNLSSAAWRTRKLYEAWYVARRLNENVGAFDGEKLISLTRKFDEMRSQELENGDVRAPDDLAATFYRFECEVERLGMLLSLKKHHSTARGDSSGLGQEHTPNLDLKLDTDRRTLSRQGASYRDTHADFDNVKGDCWRIVRLLVLADGAPVNLREELPEQSDSNRRGFIQRINVEVSNLDIKAESVGAQTWRFVAVTCN